MEVRQIEPIDRAELRATIQKWIDAHTDVDDTDGVGLLEDVLWEINAQPTLTPPNEWVSVENALPEECADILLCRKILKIPEIGTYQQARFWVYDEIGDVYQVDDVTHWLPIPTPYDIEHIHISEPPEG